MQAILNDNTSCAVELPTQLDTELMDRPPLTPAAQDGDRSSFFLFLISNGLYFAMGKALDADIAGVEGIDDVEDMLDDEAFFNFQGERFLSRQLL